jgi:large subunit ribosomal protein L11
MIMGKETIEILVEGGKATAAPPLGPSLAPLKVNVGNVVTEINKKTAAMKGMKVPVKVIVDTAKKTFEIEVGTPPVSALIKRELNIEKGSGEAGKARVGDLTDEQVKKISTIKFASTDKRYTEMIKGTARSMGITVGKGAVTAEEIAAHKAAKKAAEAAAAAVPAEATAEAGGEKKEDKGKDAAGGKDKAAGGKDKAAGGKEKSAGKADSKKK